MLSLCVCLATLVQLGLAREGVGFGPVAGPAVNPHLAHVPDVVHLADMVEELGLSKDRIYDSLSKLGTLCQIAGNALKQINDVDIPTIRQVNTEQDTLIDDFKAQTKDLLHRLDAAQATVTATLNLTTTTNDTIHVQLSEGTLAGDINDQQNIDIELLQNRTVEAKEDFLDDLDDALIQLDHLLGDVNQTVDEVTDVIDGKRCEYGLVALCPEEETNVTFLSSFDKTPEISLGIVGFSGHFDTTHHNYDKSVLALDKGVVDIEQSYFLVNLTAAQSSEEVTISHVYASWMACQNLDGSD